MARLLIYHPDDFPNFWESDINFYNDGTVEAKDVFGAVKEGDVVVFNLPMLSTDAFCPCPKLELLNEKAKSTR